MIVGLQEVELIQTDTDPPILDGPLTPANTTVFDFLQMLLQELTAQGTPYTMVTSATNATAEVPTALGFDVKLTDHDVILAKANLPADELSWTDQGSANFDASHTFQTAGGPLEFTRGYNVADFTANGRSFRLVNTHLEAFDPAVRDAQAAELLDPGGVLADSTQKQVLVGDINSDANSEDPSESATYDLFTSASVGFADAWTQANPFSAGLTDGFGEFLLDLDASVFRTRIDVVLTRNASGPATSARIYGTDPDNRTPGGLWPSDHAGVMVRLTP
jgi:hypothetical protein